MKHRQSFYRKDDIFFGSPEKMWIYWVLDFTVFYRVHMREQDLKSTTHLYNELKAKHLTINTFRTLSDDVIQILSQK